MPLPQQRVASLEQELRDEVIRVDERCAGGEPARSPPNEVDVRQRACGVAGEVQRLRLEQDQLLVAEDGGGGGVARIDLEPERGGNSRGRSPDGATGVGEVPDLQPVARV